MAVNALERLPWDMTTTLAAYEPGGLMRALRGSRALWRTYGQAFRPVFARNKILTLAKVVKVADGNLLSAGGARITVRPGRRGPTTVQCIDTDSGEVLFEHVDDGRLMALSPSGKRLAYTTRDGTLVVDMPHVTMPGSRFIQFVDENTVVCNALLLGQRVISLDARVSTWIDRTGNAKVVGDRSGLYGLIRLEPADETYPELFPLDVPRHVMGKCVRMARLSNGAVFPLEYRGALRAALLAHEHLFVLDDAGVIVYTVRGERVRGIATPGTLMAMHPDGTLVIGDQQTLTIVDWRTSNKPHRKILLGINIWRMLATDRALFLCFDGEVWRI